MRIWTKSLTALCWPLLVLVWSTAPIRASTPPVDQSHTEIAQQEASATVAARHESDLDNEAWDEEPEDRGRSFLYKEFVVSTSFAEQESDSFVLSHRSPGSYVALDYVRTFTPASRANRALPQWLQLSAMDLHPRFVYYGEMPDMDDMDMGEGIDWPMPDGEDMNFAPQDFWVRFQLAGNDRLSLRLGQIALPYGVNPLIAPRQTFILPVEELDLGLKWDWGFALKGPLGEHDWEVAATMGSGEAWHSPSSMGGTRPSSHLFTGRLGSPSYWNFQYGVSALVGKLPTLHGPYMADDFALSRRRLSLDGSYKAGTFLSFGGQVTYGQDGSASDEDHVFITGGTATADVLGYRAWFDWVAPGNNDLRFACQYESMTRDLNTPDSTDSAVILEFSYSLTTEITFKIDFQTILEDFMGMDDGLHFTFVYYGT